MLKRTYNENEMMVKAPIISNGYEMWVLVGKKDDKFFLSWSECTAITYESEEDIMKDFEQIIADVGGIKQELRTLNCKKALCEHCGVDTKERGMVFCTSCSYRGTRGA